MSDKERDGLLTSIFIVGTDCPDNTPRFFFCTLLHVPFGLSRNVYTEHIVVVYRGSNSVIKGLPEDEGRIGFCWVRDVSSFSLSIFIFSVDK